jgi:hypothetical protein
VPILSAIALHPAEHPQEAGPFGAKDFQYTNRDRFEEAREQPQNRDDAAVFPHLFCPAVFAHISLLLDHPASLAVAVFNTADSCSVRTSPLRLEEEKFVGFSANR